MLLSKADVSTHLVSNLHSLWQTTKHGYIPTVYCYLLPTFPSGASVTVFWHLELKSSQSLTGSRLNFVSLYDLLALCQSIRSSGTLFMSSNTIWDLSKTKRRGPLFVLKQNKTSSSLLFNLGLKLVFLLIISSDTDRKM